MGDRNQARRQPPQASNTTERLANFDEMPAFKRQGTERDLTKAFALNMSCLIRASSTELVMDAIQSSQVLFANKPEVCTFLEKTFSCDGLTAKAIYASFLVHCLATFSNLGAGPRASICDGELPDTLKAAVFTGLYKDVTSGKNIEVVRPVGWMAALLVKKSPTDGARLFNHASRLHSLPLKAIKGIDEELTENYLKYLLTGKPRQPFIDYLGEMIGNRGPFADVAGKRGQLVRYRKDMTAYQQTTMYIKQVYGLELVMTGQMSKKYFDYVSLIFFGGVKTQLPPYVELLAVAWAYLCVSSDKPSACNAAAVLGNIEKLTWKAQPKWKPK